MLISLKEYKLLKYGKTTFYPGKIKIWAKKDTITRLKSVAIYDEINYFNKSWLKVEFGYQKKATINMAIAKLQNYKGLYINNTYKAKAKIVSLCNALSEMGTVVRYAEDVVICIYENDKQQNIEYLLCTQNYLNYKMLCNTIRSEAYKILNNEVSKLNNAVQKISLTSKKPVYLDPKIIKYAPDYLKFEEWEKE